MSGQMIVILGLDGSGKSAVIKGLSETLDKVYSEVVHMHLRPRLGTDTSKLSFDSVSDPHGLPKRGWLFSVCKIFYFLLDYNLGHWLKVRPLLRDKKLVIFDRYYQDFLMDPKRFRYGGPAGLVQWASQLIPQGKHVIFLDAPVEVLRSRKQELGAEEMERQRQSYLNLMKTLPNGTVIDSSQPLETVISQVKNVITR